MVRLKNYNILKAAAWYTIGNILIRGVSFFALPVFTALMSTYDYGVYSVYSSYLSIFETIILFGLSSTVSLARFSDHIEFEHYMTTIVVIPPLLSFISGIFINLYLGLNGSLFSLDTTLWNFLLISAATTAVAAIIQAKLVLEGQYRIYMLHSTFYTIGNLGLSLLLCYTVFRTDRIYMARVVGNCVASSVGMLFLLMFAGTRGRVIKTYFKQAAIWGIPLLFHTAATVLLTQTDRIFIQHLVGYSAAGIYTVAITITIIPLTLQTSFSSAWTPWFYNELEQKNYSLIRRMNDKYIFLFAVIIAELSLISPEIIHIFSDEPYWDSIYCLIPLLISVFGEMLYSIPVAVEYFHKKTKYIVTGTVLCLVCNIILDYVFIVNFGYIAAAYATAISKLVLFLLHKVLAKKLDNNQLFHKHYVVVSLLFLAGINLVTVMGVDAVVFRLGLFLAIGMIFLWFVWKNYAQLMEMFVKKSNK